MQIDFFYLAMPVIRDIADGSQDALLVRVRKDGITGWGECEASPLVSLANWVCPMSHAACKSVQDAVAGARIGTPADLIELGHRVRASGLDVAQTDHTWSGLEIALWDWLGKRLNEPVYRLLGYPQAYPKIPYASRLFGETPEETYQKALASGRDGFRAVKFGWGPFGKSDVQADRDQVEAARAGLGPDAKLLVDAGTIWRDDVEAAAARLDALEAHQATWLEEPFVGEALASYQALAARCRRVRLAGGEGASNFYAAQHLIDYGQIGYVQIDTGRIGGIAPAKQVAEYAAARNVTFVNHTFTTQLALAASLAPYVGMESAELCEYPVEASSLAQDLTNHALPIIDGLVRTPEQPGLGVEVQIEAIRRYLVDVEITVRGKTLYRTPSVD